MIEFDEIKRIMTSPSPEDWAVARRQKTKAVKTQHYELACFWRDMEKHIQKTAKP